MKRSLTLKSMVNLYMNASEQERDKIWTTFWNMKCMCFIEDDVWNKFFETCRSLPSTGLDMKGFRF